LFVVRLFQGPVRVPWLSFAKCLPLYALAVAHFTFNWGYYTLLTCLPQYFKHILQFDIKSVRTDNVITVETKISQQYSSLINGFAFDALSQNVVLTHDP